MNATDNMDSGASTGPKVALVTGARTGVGLALTRQLLDRGWQVATLTRSPLPNEPDLDKAARTGALRQYFADLADFVTLRVALASIRERETVIELLVNNAGVNPEHFERSPQGREMNVEVNTVAPYIIARELLPVLERSRKGRILNVSSNAARMAKTFDVAKLGAGDRETYRKLFGAYANSKLALSLWTDAVAPEFAQRGVHILSVDPGGTKSPLTAGAGMPWPLKLLAKVLFKPPGVAAGKFVELIEGGKPFDPGSYVEKGMARPLPRQADAKAVLSLVDRIHRETY